jgi:hypothetical protein
MSRRPAAATSACAPHTHACHSHFLHLLYLARHNGNMARPQADQSLRGFSVEHFLQQGGHSEQRAACAANTIRMVLLWEFNAAARHQTSGSGQQA